MSQLMRFLRDEEGLVTLEWVALAAAVIVLAIGVIVVIQTQVTTAASTLGSKIVTTVQSNTQSPGIWRTAGSEEQFWPDADDCVRLARPFRRLFEEGCLMKNSFRLFLRDDEGLVTLEWVALAAAVIVLAIGTIIVIQTQLNTAASTVGSEIVSTVQSNT